jgi:hypothetical protein
VERWRLARRRPHPCFSRAAVKAARQRLVPVLKARPFKKRPGARQALVAGLDRPALRPHPAPPAAEAEWKQARLTSDDPVEVDGDDDAGP